MRRFLDRPVTMKSFLAGLIVVVVLSAAMSAGGDEATRGLAGPEGKAGKQGPRGPKGERGPRGPRGKRGETVTSPTTAAAGEGNTTSGSSTIEDGTWEVGVDIAAGTYRAAGGESCYWEILKGPPRGTSIDNIVENDVASSNVIVTLSDGQWFNTEQCGTWSGR